MSLKSDKTISGNTAKEFLENLINFFHAWNPYHLMTVNIQDIRFIARERPCQGPSIFANQT